VNVPTVQWTVGKEGTPSKRGRSLINFLYVHKKIERNFPIFKREGFSLFLRVLFLEAEIISPP
ncbi:MAG: hypothetical protein J6K77_04065, partial [Ruminococcus sp.]|nr:hypothetical protein [Ruminococcus sp.]